MERLCAGNCWMLLIEAVAIASRKGRCSNSRFANAQAVAASSCCGKLPSAAPLASVRIAAAARAFRSGLCCTWPGAADQRELAMRCAPKTALQRRIADAEIAALSGGSV